MKSVEILIPNFNAGDAIKLCVESIRRYTDYPHSITVRDDASWQSVNAAHGHHRVFDDVRYLRECQSRGWLKLIEGAHTIMHGSSVGILLDQCTADLAMLMDCDIQILAPGWLDEMVAWQEWTGAALITTTEHFPDDNDCLQSWWIMIDMAQYASIRTDWNYRYREDGKEGMRATGYFVRKNALDQGRPVAPIPKSVLGKFRHHAHVSVLTLDPDDSPIWAAHEAKYRVIQDELLKLRAGR